MISEINARRMEWDLGRLTTARYEKFWLEEKKQVVPSALFQNPKIYLEIGAGSGSFVVGIAKQYSDTFFIAVERDKLRGQRLVEKAKKSGLNNIACFRGNAIPDLLHGIPADSVDRIYLLYPCPWPKTAQRKNRWYLHPIMPHLVRILKKGGLLIWASDQKFFVDEAHFVSERKFNLLTLVHQEVTPNAYNDLALFPGGRTKFEQTFLQQNQPCYELISQKPSA